jgi:hypothetical protein
MPPLQHGQLLAESQILQSQIPTATKEADEHSAPEHEQIQHGPDLYQMAIGKIVASC